MEISYSLIVILSFSISADISSTFFTTSKKRSTESVSKIKVLPVSKLSGGKGSSDSRILSSSVKALLFDSIAVFSMSSIVWSDILPEIDKVKVEYFVLRFSVPLLIEE